MLVRFWGTRGSLPVALRADEVLTKVVRALMIARGRRFESEAEAAAFARSDLAFATQGTYGGATSCVEIEGADGAFVVCDLGSGLREFGLSAQRRCAEGHPRLFHVFLSHTHWDHIMGLPFFRPAFDSGATIVVHSGHADAEEALRRQQGPISFPVPFEAFRARFEFVTHQPWTPFEAAGMKVSLVRQDHARESFGFRFEKDDKAVVYSTDAEHKPDEMEVEDLFQAFFRHADLVIADTMYSLADAVSLKQDLGHSSNIVAVDLCHAAGARRLALFHHEPSCSDEDIERMHGETVRYEELVRDGRPKLQVVCAYDGLEIEV
ncbi:MAG TPA: MBL fold metallo-hydrolase [Caulobacteraceae bacterium]|nr:MBL fold metallo-hydrolase [Caulobacteraceae bacterium]